MFKSGNHSRVFKSANHSRVFKSVNMSKVFKTANYSRVFKSANISRALRRKEKILDFNLIVNCRFVIGSFSERLKFAVANLGL